MRRNKTKLLITTLVIALLTSGVLSFSGQAVQYNHEITKLRVTVPSSVLMYEPFPVVVTDLQGNPLPDADVTFFIHYPDDIPYYNESKLTNMNGIAWFVAPHIPVTLVGYIEVFKEGYGNAVCLPITIINPYISFFDEIV